ncbi:DUF2125 domain-containing protein [Paracoccus siganidrum]|uniref:DUF2125 domain-containing protein n=1 Tax=Paracoccus siganidrum TaxID=1276757 RepID=A0A419ABT7_9RHOB|nr:DUF2125 domain-containing protein [Paracoccus siganidrum]RJL21303.1 DUF2125 domain-containing protein [Paracoccus siganidrum]RMC37052.1 DUF2125 domain-containing protein [Paracoccus siganidrum]
MFRTLATSTVALIAGAAPLFAEVTPAQVWENLTSYYDKIGYEVVVGTQEDGGDTLTLGDVVVKSPESEDYTVSVNMPKITLSRTGDAKVRTVFDGDIDVDFTTAVPEGEDIDFDMTISMPGNEMVTSGTPEDLLHEFNYPSMVMALNLPQAETDGDTAPVTVTMTDIKGTQTTKVSDGTESVYDMTAASLAVAMAMNEPAAEDGTPRDGRMTAAFDIADLVMSGSMTTPEGEMDLTNDIAGALNAGMVTDGKFVMGPMTGTFDFTATDEAGGPRNGAGTFSAENGELVVAMSKEGVSYEGKSGRTEAEMTVADLPFPISYALDGASGAVSFPVAKSDQPQPFKFAYEIAGLTLADGIWDLFDEGGQLPRDPAMLAIDLEGEALVSQDLFDPAFGQMAAEGEDAAMADEDMPFLPQNVKINRVALDAVGATADVTGQLDLSDNPQEPVGEINGSFSGVNGLLDKLIAMGLVPQEQAMGVRMMLAMFAKPVDGDPDRLETKLEFREGGSIFANGQQVK